MTEQPSTHVADLPPYAVEHLDGRRWTVRRFRTKRGAESFARREMQRTRIGLWVENIRTHERWVP